MLIPSPRFPRNSVRRRLNEDPRRLYGLQEEPPELQGLLFQQYPDGTVRVLRRSGETDPDSVPDIPADAVMKGSVFISVDGIGQNWNRHREQIRDWFHGGADFGTSLPVSVIGIHEGEGQSGLHDGLRILKDTALNKTLQSGRVSTDWVRQRAYQVDPAVKTVYDQLRQSLKAGRQVTLMVHSGGGAQVALALSLLACEEDGPWRQRIADDVRILGTAPAASRQDFEWAGVEADSIMVTGSRRDPVHAFFRNHLDPGKPCSLLPFAFLGVATSLRFALKPGPFHQGEYIFGSNQRDGVHQIGEFLAGGPGHDSLIP
jgi:hypothetical protein